MITEDHRLACLHIAAELLRKQMPMDMEGISKTLVVVQPKDTDVIETAKKLAKFVDGTS